MQCFTSTTILLYDINTLILLFGRLNENIHDNRYRRTEVIRALISTEAQALFSYNGTSTLLYVYIIQLYY